MKMTPSLIDEDVLARAVGDVAVLRQEDRLVVPGALGLVHREHRVEVDAGRLRRVRDRVRPDTLPRRDHRAAAVPLALLAEVRAPREGEDRHLDVVAARVHTELPVAVVRDRAQVRLVEPVDGERLVTGRPELVDRVRQSHVEQLGRRLQTLEVVAQAEDRRPALGRVAADALEDAGAVVEAVARDVDLGVRPVHELAVHPDLLGLLHCRNSSRRRRCPGRTARDRRTSSVGGQADHVPGRAPADPDAVEPEQRSLDAARRRRAGRPNGATAPGSNPVALRTRAGDAMLALRAPQAAATLRASARRSPGTIARRPPSRSRRRATSRCCGGRSRQRARHVPPSACPSRTPPPSPRHAPRGERRDTLDRLGSFAHRSSRSFAQR